MPKEAVERLGIRLCCRQVGTWGTRYTVARQDFNKMPRSFGDEEKISLYFGHKACPPPGPAHHLHASFTATSH
jgi:hypothetical protein